MWCKCLISFLPGQKMMKDLEKASMLEGVTEVTPELSSQTKQMPEMTEEEKTRIVEEFKAANLKKIKTSVMKDGVLSPFKESLEQLVLLKKELIEKKDAANEISLNIKNKINNLSKNSAVQINQKELVGADKSVKEYLDLLQNVANEVETELTKYSMLLPDKSPEEVTVWKTEPDDFEQYIQGLTKIIKKYAKNVRKDIAISFSRYCFGFEEQLKRISYIEAYLAAKEKK